MRYNKRKIETTKERRKQITQTQQLCSIETKRNIVSNLSEFSKDYHREAMRNALPLF